MTITGRLLCGLSLVLCPSATADHPFAAPGITSLANPEVKYSVHDEAFVEISRAEVTAVFVTNAAVDNDKLPGHRAGYNGLASLTHRDRKENLLVPAYAGLNFEHIHDGTLRVNKEKFEPRRNPMEMRIVDEFTVELYQAPTRNWELESCGRYRLLGDGTIEYVFECIPRSAAFSGNMIGLFWASYIHQPEDTAAHFMAVATAGDKWVRSVSESHGVDATHPPAGQLPDLDIHPDFPLTLVNHRSQHRYAKPFYFGVSHDMAFVQIFRSADRIWFAQSPSGGGNGNPAWDFQWFVPDCEVDEAYGFVMRAAYVPYQSRDQILAVAERHLAELNRE